MEPWHDSAATTAHLNPGARRTGRPGLLNEPCVMGALLALYCSMGVASRLLSRSCSVVWMCWRGDRACTHAEARVRGGGAWGGSLQACRRARRHNGLHMSVQASRTARAQRSLRFGGAPGSGQGIEPAPVHGGRRLGRRRAHSTGTPLCLHLSPWLFQTAAGTCPWGAGNTGGAAEPPIGPALNTRAESASCKCRRETDTPAGKRRAATLAAHADRWPLHQRCTHGMATGTCCLQAARRWHPCRCSRSSFGNLRTGTQGMCGSVGVRERCLSTMPHEPAWWRRHTRVTRYREAERSPRGREGMDQRGAG